MWLSGGVPLKGVTWQPYNVTPGVTWVVQQNENAIYGQDSQPFVLLNATYNTWNDCQSACQANFTAGGPCTVNSVACNKILTACKLP